MAEKKIEGFGVIRTSPIMASEAIALYCDMMRIVGTGANRLPALLLGSAIDDVMADVAILSALTDILRGTPTDEVNATIGKILACGQMQRPSKAWETIELDLDFSDGKIKYLIPVVRFLLKEQFGDFFTGSAGNGILSKLRSVLLPAKSSE